MDWDDVRHFLALARSGSARAAGAALGVSHSTIVRRIDAFEARLEVRLFDRTRDGYALTAAGHQMRPRAERVEQEIAAIERQLAGQDERLAGTVSITCCDSYVSNLVLGELAGFIGRHPGIELSVVNDGRIFDLSRREADVALRVVRAGEQPQPSLIGRKLVPLKMASYVARDRAAQLDPDRGAISARWVSFDDRRMMEWLVSESSHPELPIWGAFGTLELMHQTARRGLGIVMLPTYVGDSDRHLVRLAQPDLRHLADIWIVSHPDLRDNARLRATRSALTEGLLHHRALFEGDRCADAPTGSEITPGEAAAGSLG